MCDTSLTPLDDPIQDGTNSQYNYSGYSYLSDDLGPANSGRHAGVQDYTSAPEIDWNVAFKAIHALPDSPHKYQALSKLAKDFTHASTLYAKLIISELFLKDENKTLKPVKIGGVAGGSKYIAQGILLHLLPSSF